MTAFLVKKLANRSQSCRCMCFSMGHVLSVFVKPFAFDVAIACADVPCFPATSYGAQQNGTSGTELRKEACLLLKAIRDGWETEVKEIIFGVGSPDCLHCSLDPIVEFLDVGQHCCGSAGRLCLSLFRTKLGGLSVLPPRNGYCDANADHRENGLNICGSIFPELNLAGDTKQSEARCKAQGHQQRVNENRRPVDSIPRFHVDLPPIHKGRIRTPLPIGEGC